MFNPENTRIMKKSLFILAILSLAATACNKAETAPAPDYSRVPVSLSVTLPEMPTKANFSLTDSDNPVGGMTVTWAENDRLTLIVFQGDDADWKDNCVYTQFTMPDTAEGQTSCDVSSLGTLDLSTFNPSQNLKYVVVLGPRMDPYRNHFRIWNGMVSSVSSATLSQQINAFEMMAETDVQEVPFPTGSLTLSGSLHWITSVLAVQFEIDSAADITYKANSWLGMRLQGAKYVDCYSPITKRSSYVANTTSRFIYFSGSEGKLSGALDVNKCRYFTIPADNMTTNPDQKLAGSTISFYKKDSIDDVTEYSSTGSIATTTVIEPGKVYGIKIKVTDTNGDSEPEFTKM